MVVKEKTKAIKACEIAKERSRSAIIMEALQELLHLVLNGHVN